MGTASEQNIDKLTYSKPKFKPLGLDTKIQKAQLGFCRTILFSALKFKCWFFFLIDNTLTAITCFIINEWVWRRRSVAGGSINIYNIAIYILRVNFPGYSKHLVRRFRYFKTFTCCLQHNKTVIKVPVWTRI